MKNIEESPINFDEEKRFVDLNWRLESRIASRSLNAVDSQNIPQIGLLVKITSSKEMNYVYIHLRTLKTIINALEQGLIETQQNCILQLS